MDAWEEFHARVAESRERLQAAGKHSITYISGRSMYGHKVVFAELNTPEARNLSDFDLMVWADGNPCFGGHVERNGDTVRITVNTD